MEVIRRDGRIFIKDDNGEIEFSDKEFPDFPMK